MIALLTDIRDHLARIAPEDAVKEKSEDSKSSK
jgi:hypothetical protein